MERTINGKTMKQIMEELQADFPQSAILTRDYDGVKYINVDSFRERLDSVLGKEHYNELYEEVQIIQTRDTISTRTKCRIEFLDDNFDVILIKESAGGSIINFPKLTDEEGNKLKEESTSTTSIPNDIDAACQDAFKRICRKTLGLGKHQLGIAKQGFLYENVYIKNCKPYNNNMIFGDVVYKQTNYKFVCFKNSYNIFKNTYGSDKLSNTYISFYGKEDVDKNRNKRLIFNNPYQSLAEPNTTSQIEGKSTNVNNNNVSNCIVFPEGPFIKTIMTKSKLKDLECQKGSYYVDVLYNKRNVKLIFLKENIEKIDSNLWNTFINNVNAKETLVNAIFIGRNNKLYFKEFSSSTAS